MKHKIFFINEKTKQKYESLKEGNDSDRRLYKNITKAMEDISDNPFAGIRLNKIIVPKEYKIYGVEKLLKYDLPRGWRMIYSVTNEEIEIYAVIIEWFDHKNYENRFHYII